MSSVLYDAPGPRGRQRILIGSLIAGVGVLGVVFLAVRRLADNGQFEAEKWAPLFDPSTEEFPLVWALIGEAAVKTLTAAALSITFSLIIGTLLAVSRITATRIWRVPIVGLIELLRGVPVVIAIFFASRVLPSYGVDLPDTRILFIPLDELMWYVVIGLTAYNSVVIAEIIRAGVNSLPRGQGEAASAIGLTRGQTLRLILLPQAFRVMLPALISQLVVVLKDTSLGAFIGWQELLRAGTLIKETTDNPIQMYLVIGAMFIIVNYLLGRLAQYVERRLSRSRAGGAAEAAEHALETTGAGPSAGA
jgi:glutamate transport system permease protein